MPNFTIYVTGGGEYFYTTLNGVAMIFNDGKLIYSVIFLGSMFALLTGAWYFIQKNIGSGLLKTHTWIEHAFVMVILSFLAFVPTRVIVQDIYGQQNATPIDNVPLIISFPAAMFSGVNHDIFRAIDTAYQSTTGSTMAVSENGFVTPLKLMLSMRGGLQEVAPEAYQSWFNYIGSCLYNTASTTGGMAQSPDVASFLTQNGKDGGFVKVFLRQAGSGIAAVQDGVVVTCSEAKTLLDLRMEALFASGTGANPSSDVDRLINQNMGEANRNAANGRWTWTDAMTAANGFQIEVGASAQSAQQYMKNSLMRSVVVDAFNCAANYLNTTDQMLCTQAMHDSMEQYKVDAAGQGSWFSQMMLPAMTILQLLFFAFSVVAFLYGIIRGAGAVGFIGKYFLFGAWVFSWLPFVAIINAFINWMVVDKMRMSTLQALTIENYDSYFQKLQASLALASNLLAATPLITLGFLTGSMFALSSFAQRLSSNDYFKEQNVAPNTVDVAPVMRHESEFQSNPLTGQRTAATTYEQVSVGDALNSAKESRRVEAVSSQLQTADQASQMFRAMESVGGATRITNTDSNIANASEGEMFQAGLRSMRTHMDSSGFSQGDKTEAEARVKASLELMGTGASVSAAMKKAMDGTQNKNVQSGIENMISGMSSYAESTGRQVASAISHDSTFSGNKSAEVASGFSETASKSESLAKSYAEIASRANSVDSKQTADVSVLGSKLEQDRNAGTAGKGIDRKINEAYNDLIKQQGAAKVEGETRRKLEDWTRSGAHFTTMPEMAQLQTIRAMGDGVAYSNIVSDLFAAGSAPVGDAQSFQGVSGAAGSVQPQLDPSHHNARVDAVMPGAGDGRASLQSTEAVKGQLAGNNDLNQNIKGRVAAGMDDKLMNTSNGVLNHNKLSPKQALNAQLEFETARNNISNPPQNRDDYLVDLAKAKLVASTTGGDVLEPIPPESVKAQWLQDELSNARHPSNLRGDTPQEREAHTAQAEAEAIGRVNARVAGITQKNYEAAGASHLDAPSAAGGGLGSEALKRPVASGGVPEQGRSATEFSTIPTAPPAISVGLPSGSGTGPQGGASGPTVADTNTARHAASAIQPHGSDYVAPASSPAGSVGLTSGSGMGPQGGASGPTVADTNTARHAASAIQPHGSDHVAPASSPASSVGLTSGSGMGPQGGAPVATVGDANTARHASPATQSFGSDYVAPASSHGSNVELPSGPATGSQGGASSTDASGANDARQAAPVNQSFGSDYVAPDVGRTGNSLGEGVEGRSEHRPASATAAEAAPMRRSSFPEQPLPSAAGGDQQASLDDKPAVPPAPNALRQDVNAKAARGQDQRGGGQTQRPRNADGAQRQDSGSGKDRK